MDTAIVVFRHSWHRWTLVLLIVPLLLLAGSRQTVDAQAEERSEYSTLLVTWDPAAEDPSLAYYLQGDRDDAANSIDAFLNRYASDGWTVVNVMAESWIAREEVPGYDGPFNDTVRWRIVLERVMEPAS